MDSRFGSSGHCMALLAVAASLAACAPTTPRLDSGFGTSVRATFAAQKVNPAAVRNTDPVSGIDGRAARAAHEQYERSFTAPAPSAAPMVSNAGTGK